MKRRRCAACGEVFRRRSQVPEQRYCGSPGCRQERRRRWQRDKRRANRDYRHNQTQAQRAWAAAHTDYWRNYRLTHPEYSERNPPSELCAQGSANRSWEADRLSSDQS